MGEFVASPLVMLWPSRMSWQRELVLTTSAIALLAALWGTEPAVRAASANSPEPAASATAPPPKRRYVVAAMGDSLTDPRSHGGKYLDVLRKRCPQSRFDSYGKGANMVNQMRKRFARDILGKPPNPDQPKPAYTHVIVLGGINDICSDRTAGRSNDKIQADLEAMYDMAHAHRIAVVAITLPPWGGFKRYYNKRRAASTLTINRWIKQQRGKKGKVDALVDVYPLLSCGEPELLCERYGWPDKVHWSKAGHQVVGKALHRQVFADCR